jgi:electron transport complex protein RnfA
MRMPLLNRLLFIAPNVVLMASIRESIEFSDVPDLAKGTGLVLIIAGTLSLAFMGIAGML